MIHFSKTAATLLLATIIAVAQAQNPFAPINNFNVFAENNVTMKSGDVEGGIAAGGNFTIDGNSQITTNSSGTGNVYGTVSGVNYGLVVNGAVNYTSGGFNLNANGSNHWLKIGNLNGGAITMSGQNMSIQNGAVRIQVNSTNQTQGQVVGSGIMNFTTIMNTMRTTSAGLATCTNNVVPTYDFGSTTPKLTMIANTKNVWNITGATLSTYNTITFNNQPTASQPLIINVNVTGTYNWTIPNMSGIGRSEGRYIVFNFYNVSTINMNAGGTVEGSILAPNATINKIYSANIEGQVVCVNYMQAGGEVHVAHFNASAPPCSNCTPPTANITGTFTTCNGSSTTLTATGGGTYAWNTGETSASISKTAGTYTVTVSNGTNCSSTSAVTVTNTPLPTANITGTFVTCNNNSTTLTATGGGTYAWNTGETSASVMKAAGTYTVTVTNATGCSSTTAVTVTNTASPTGVTAAAASSTCWAGVAQNNGSITLSGFAASARYQYSAGSTFSTGAAVPSGITTIPTGGVIANALANPSGATQIYTVRLYHSTNNNCFIDINVTLNRVICNCPNNNCGNVVLRKN